MSLLPPLLVETASQAALVVKNLPANAGDRRYGFNLWVRKIPSRRKWQHTPVFLPGELHGQRSLAGYSPWGSQSRTQLSDFHFFLSVFNQCFAYKHLHSFQTPVVTDRAIVNTVLSVYDLTFSGVSLE